jgi:hypothetical protein
MDIVDSVMVAGAAASEAAAYIEAKRNGSTVPTSENREAIHA